MIDDKNAPEVEVLVVDNDEELLDSIGSELEIELLNNVADADNPNHYVNNKELLAAITEFVKDHRYAAEHELPEPRVPEFIGECFIKMANKIGTKKNFANYPHLDEMKGDAIENCLRYVKNFNPDKSDNPFAYYSTFIHRAFFRRIEAEKKQLYIQALKVRRMGSIEDSFDVMDDDESEYHNTYVQHLQENGDDWIRDFEEKLRAKREKVASRKTEQKQSKGLKDKAKKKTKGE